MTTPPIEALLQRETVRYRERFPDAEAVALRALLSEHLSLLRDHWEAPSFPSFWELLSERTRAVDQLKSVHLLDLFRVHAFLRNERWATEDIARILDEDVAPRLRTRFKSDEVLNEALQRVRTSVLMQTPERPSALREYRGQGPLQAWLAVATIRAAFIVENEQPRSAPLDLAEQFGQAPSPEWSYLKAHYSTRFEQALRTAVGMLTSKERTLLRHQVLDGLGNEGVAAIYGVHASTASRWLSQAKARLYLLTRAALMELLRIESGEVDSILRLIQSNLPQSIGPLLQTPTGR
jgi:RNA polymerase sigma-70 factor, ECF subfamily